MQHESMTNGYVSLFQVKINSLYTFLRLKFYEVLPIKTLYFTMENVGCQSSWEDSRCEVRYYTNNPNVNFCLHCNDWVREKSKVFDTNWTMVDDEGNLRYDVS